jgi:hypothetical protein
MAENEQQKKTGQNALGRLNEVLFAELDRLSAVDIENEDAVKLEISRSKAIEGIAKTTVDNAKTVLDATRLKAEFGQQTHMPKMLEG